jgi:Zn-dependent protease
MQIESLFQIAILIMSVVIHEISHGYAALLLGDPTARLAGRLTLNPLKHLDPVGSLAVPAILIITKAPFILGWAKPVPYNLYNLKPGRLSEPIVAAAGPLANILIAIIFGLILRFTLSNGYASEGFVAITMFVVLINIALAVFNLMPIPPLDGSKLLFAILPDKYYHFRHTLERHGFLLIILFLLVAWKVIFPVILFTFKLITGFAI